MSEPFIGEIKIFSGNYAPRGWAFCNGQILDIASHSSGIFPIIGTIYGGDGRTTFALPDLRGRTPKHGGQGPGLSDFRLGQKGGRETHTLSTSELPSHNHQTQLFAEAAAADSESAEGKMLAKSKSPTYAESNNTTQQLATESVVSQNTGGSQPFSTEDPYLTVNYIIALEGIFPSRS